MQNQGASADFNGAAIGTGRSRGNACPRSIHTADEVQRTGTVGGGVGGGEDVTHAQDDATGVGAAAAVEANVARAVATGTAVDNVQDSIVTHGE